MRARGAWAVVLVALVGCGGGEQPRAAAPSRPPAGTFDVDGHAMFIECKGDGEPTVILDSGLGVDSASTWAAVRPKVARFARVCIYDRAGMASSEPGPKPRTIAHMTAELHELLAAARLEPSYVLVGASLGGMNAQLFAATHPKETAGVVLVDSLHPDLDRRIEPLLGRRGARIRREQLAGNAEGVTFADLLASDDELRAVRADFPPVPLIVLEHGISFEPGGAPVPRIERLWGELQRDNAALSPKGRVVVAAKSHHRIAEDEPDVVVRAIREVVERARDG